MKVALVHDDLVQWGGAEKVLLSISEVFPEAPIYTSVFDFNNSLLIQNFGSKQIKTSFLQKIPGWKNFYKGMLPLYPIAFEQFDFSEYDLVISQTTRFAKAIITKPETVHISYNHTPPRFLWNFSGEKPSPRLAIYLSFLRLYDSIIAKSRVDYFMAGSFNAQNRILEIYKSESEVLQPFVDIEQFENLESFDGGYYLIIARLNPYKRVGLAVEAFNRNGKRLIVVGGGPEEKRLKFLAKENIEFLNSVSEGLLLSLLSGCKGLIVTAEEDFGMTPLEAQAAGKGVIAYKKGGALETVKDLETGVLFEEQTVESLQDAIEKFEKLEIDSENCRKVAKSFSKENFKKELKKIISNFINLKTSGSITKV